MPKFGSASLIVPKFTDFGRWPDLGEIPVMQTLRKLAAPSAGRAYCQLCHWAARRIRWVESH